MSNQPKPFEPELRLVFQGSINIACPEMGETFYKELKLWIKIWDPNFTINAQIVKLLEPCCKDRKEIKNNGNPT